MTKKELKKILIKKYSKQLQNMSKVNLILLYDTVQKLEKYVKEGSF